MANFVLMRKLKKIISFKNQYSIIPSFHYSIIPLFHYSIRQTNPEIFSNVKFVF